MQRKWIEHRLENIALDDLEGSLNSVITYLAELPDEYREQGYRNFRLNSSGWNDHHELELVCDRQETQQEFDRRKKRLLSSAKAVAAKRVKKEKNDVKLLNRLVKKYGVDAVIIE